MPSIAIIGAGCSGLAAAHTLRDAGYTVVLFEKSAGVGGRAATRKRDGFIYDHGAQYIKQGSPASVALVTERFRAPDLLDIAKPVWTFDSSGKIQEGNSQQNAEPKWSYRGGLVTLGQRMAQDLDVQLTTRVERIVRHSPGWALFSETGQQLGNFDTVLITIPAPQGSDLIKGSRLDPALQRSILTSLGTAAYNPLLSVMLGYATRPQTRPYYALVNTDKKHPISWLAWEHEKAPERVPANAGLLIAQMAPFYSADHSNTPDELIVRDVAQQVAALLDEDLPTPTFSDLKRWRYALPSAKADANALNTLTIPAGLAFCGDAFVGGRVHLALEHGMDVAQQILSTFH